MSISKVTILGFERWLNAERKSLFDFMDLPEGINKETLTDNILLQAAEFEVLYSNPYSMRDYIKIWAKKHYRTFDKWITVLNIEYNPLENYDRMEEWTDNNTGGFTHNSTGTVNDSSHLEQSAINTGADNSVSDQRVNTYDSDSLHEKEQNETVSNTNLTQAIETDNTGNSSSNSTDTSTHNNNDHHIGRMHGNIGVTTSQQMLQSELDVARFNIYDQITDLFMQEFCLMIYV